MALLVDGEVGRHGPVKSGVFGPKLVHLLLGGGAHRNSAAENTQSAQEATSAFTAAEGS